VLLHQLLFSHSSLLLFYIGRSYKINKKIKKIQKFLIFFTGVGEFFPKAAFLGQKCIIGF